MVWQHIYPVNDTLEHDLTEYNPEYSCWCDPDLEVENNLIVHSAFDGRN